VKLSYKYRLYPTKAQAAFLDGQLREACSLYNAALQERIEAWKICRKSINYYDQAHQLKAMRADGCLTLANHGCCHDVLKRVDRAYRAFFARVKRGEKPGFPRYLSARRYDSITFPTYRDGCRLLDNGKLHIQGVGHTRVKRHRPVEGTIKTSTIKREAGRWFVCFVVECDIVTFPPSAEAVGIDVGLTTFAVLSDGSEIETPRFAQKAEAALRRAQRKVSRRPDKRSNRRRKAVQELQRIHAKVRNRRADFIHKASRNIVNRFGLIVVEDLNIKGLAAGMRAKFVRDAAWSLFFFCIAYKAVWAGRVFRKIDPRNTSQVCLCGASVPKTLADRWHLCSCCGLSAPRDHVSSRVILQKGRIDPSRLNAEVVDSNVPREAVGFI
jgi:putative transposase